MGVGEKACWKNTNKVLKHTLTQAKSQQGFYPQPKQGSDAPMMSIGKIPPSYFNSRRDHDSDTEYDPKPRPTTGKNASAFNGFSSNHFGAKREKEDEEEEEEEEPRPHCPSPSTSPLESYIHIEVHPNGGASMVHVYEKEIEGLSSKEKERLARLFFEEVFKEEPENVAKHVIGIVHGAAGYLPELVGHLSATRPELDIKVMLCRCCRDKPL